MKVLVVGSGGREHAIGWALARSPQVEEVLFAPGNGGTAAVGRNVAISATDLPALVNLAQTEDVALTVIGPEDPLVAGAVDRFAEAGLVAFGPTAGPAQLEGSKRFAKAFMERHGIPTGRAASFTDTAEALAYLDQIGSDRPVGSHPANSVPVIKADGLAAGKGVLMPETMDEAADAVRVVLDERRFGDACESVLIEERLIGTEASVLAFCDGTSVAIMPIAQDHKRLLDGDHGLNTGGMGAFIPSPVIDAELLADIDARVLQPVLKGMAAEGTPYVGVLYAGIMVTEDGPRVLEFNCRFGDPETQVVLPLLESDLVDVMMACVEGRLGELTLSWADLAGVTVVLASGGYPESYDTGFPISGVADAEAAGTVVFHAGTSTADDQAVVTSGGRVLAVTATGATLEAAVDQAYAGADLINFEAMVRRQDIGRSATSPAEGTP